MNLEEELRNYILKEYLPKEDSDKIHNETDLIEKGVLDSFAILQLITHMEETYQIEVGNDEISVENMGSVSRLSDFVRRKGKNR